MVIGCCLQLSYVSVICRIVNTRRTSEKIWGGFFCRECTEKENYFELIPTVEMEIRNPVEGNFGSEFPAICTHCKVMAA